MKHVKIESLGLPIPGRVVRSYDEATNTTTLLVNEDQIRSLHDTTDRLLSFFDSQQ